jgi:hypothetical protein
VVDGMHSSDDQLLEPPRQRPAVSTRLLPASTL